MGARGAAVVGFVGSRGNPGSHAGGEYGASTVLRCRRSRNVGGRSAAAQPGAEGAKGGLVEGEPTGGGDRGRAPPRAATETGDRGWRWLRRQSRGGGGPAMTPSGGGGGGWR